MMNSFSFFLASILLQSFSHRLADDQNIAKVCAKTTIPDDCKSVLMSDSRSKSAKTIPDLALIAFDIAMNDVNMAITAANDLLNKYPDKDHQGALHRCSQIYADMAAELNQGKEKVVESKYGDANGLAFDAEMKPNACDNESLTANMKDLLLQSNHDLTKKSAVCAALTFLLK